MYLKLTLGPWRLAHEEHRDHRANDGYSHAHVADCSIAHAGQQRTGQGCPCRPS